MGIAPLSAWGHSTLKTLGRAIWKPALGAVSSPLCSLPLHASACALVGFFLVALVILVTLYEYWRGAHGAPADAQGENFVVAFWTWLTARNRRRYGGYIIHLSMMLMAVGILGIELFQVDTQGDCAGEQFPQVWANTPSNTSRLRSSMGRTPGR